MRKAIVAVVVFVSLAACTTGQAHSTRVTPAPVGATAPASGVAPAAGSVDVKVTFDTSNAPAVTIKPADLKVTDITGETGVSAGQTPPSGLSILEGPTDISAGGPLPASGATLTWAIPNGKVDAGTTPFPASFDPTTSMWVPVASTYDATAGTLTAHVTHLSVWVVFGWSKAVIGSAVASALTNLLTTRALFHAATCTKPLDLKMLDSHRSGALSSCVEDHGAGAALVRVDNERSYPIDLSWPAGAVVTEVDNGDLKAEVGALLSAYSGPNQRHRILSPGGEATIVFPLGAGSSATISTAFDGEAYLTSIVVVTINELAAVDGHLGQQIGDVIKDPAVSTCLTTAQQQVANVGLTADEITRITKLATDCLRNVQSNTLPGVNAGLGTIIAGLANYLVPVINGVTQVAGTEAFHTLRITRRK